MQRWMTQYVCAFFIFPAISCFPFLCAFFICFSGLMTMSFASLVASAALFEPGSILIYGAVFELWLKLWRHVKILSWYVTIKAIEDIQYSKWLWKWSYDSLDKSESSVLLSLEHACEALLGSHFLSAHHGALSARATTAWLGLVTCFALGVLMC